MMEITFKSVLLFQSRIYYTYITQFNYIQNAFHEYMFVEICFMCLKLID